jgi:hypothetical protein
MPPNKRPKLHTATMQIKLRPDAKAAFQAEAKARGVSLSVLVVMATWREVGGAGISPETLEKEGK